MGVENERKFLLADDSWRDEVSHSQRMRQGYLGSDRRSSVRVRIAGEDARLNIKGATVGASRAEYEYPIPLADAKEILDTLVVGPQIDKTRHHVEFKGNLWEIDEFHGDNSGLIVAEIELPDPDTPFEKPDWAGQEVTADERFYNSMLSRNPYAVWPPEIEVSIAEQKLWLKQRGAVLAEYAVSTATNGAGELNGSECTPRGLHKIRARIGEGLSAGAVMVGRRPTGEIWSPELLEASPNRDWILTRILWLSGMEPGRNRLGNVDTMRRYVYIHGTPDSVTMGQPGSHGCIRMRNADLIELFDQVEAGTRVTIQE